jgi:hypothetical protein
MKNADKPAFTLQDDYSENAYGLTKREYFAAKAMQGLCANPEQIMETPEEIAELSIKFADELLKQLDK